MLGDGIRQAMVARSYVACRALKDLGSYSV